MSRASYIFMLILVLLLGNACDQTTTLFPYEPDVSLVPGPLTVVASENAVRLSDKSTIACSDGSLKQLAAILSHELKLIVGKEPDISEGKGKYADIILSVSDTLDQDEYCIDITEVVLLAAGSYQALCMARSTLLQLAFVHEGKLCFPCLKIMDIPDRPYRGLLIDLARNWHSVEEIRKLIDMASYYKTNYLHLHFTDYQSYTLPSAHFPNLSTPGRHYTFAELRQLERYALSRGVVILPEIDIPGHASSIVNAYPEIFSIAAMDENPWIINMGKERVYSVLDTLIGEIAGIFEASPYIHIGGDEAIFYKSVEDPHVIEYMAAHELGEDIHELYRHFIVRMNDIVKKHGRQMCVWEGFGRSGDVQVPKDIIVFAFETNRYLPRHLIADGYTVVNTSWKPLYVVNQKKWEPRTIYSWNLWRWENWWPSAPSYEPIQLEETPLVIGAQMCAWEQAGALEFPSLRRRLPAMNERIWKTRDGIPYDAFMKDLTETDRRLSLLVNDTAQDALLLDYNFEQPAP